VDYDLSDTIESSTFDSRDTKKQHQLPKMDLKQFPTKAYSFGVSRGDSIKVHVGEVL
jgi:hypothetical protein